MKLGGPINRDNSGKYVGQRVGSKDINDDTVMIGPKKRTVSQTIGRFFDRCVEMVIHPQAFYKENKRFKRMVRGEEEWDRDVLDKRISGRKVGLSPGFESIQTGLKRINETARQEQGMREDAEAYEFERVRALRLANEQGDIVSPMKRDEAYLNKTKAIRAGVEQEKLEQKERNAELSELYASEFGERDSEISTLQKEVAERRDMFRRWAKRKYALPWYSSKEKTVHREFEQKESAFGRPMTRKAINAEIRRAENEYYDVRMKLAKKQEERGKLHDQKRYPEHQMRVVNQELKEIQTKITTEFQETFGNISPSLREELKPGVEERVYARLVNEAVAGFREGTGDLEKELKDPSKLVGKHSDDIKKLHTALAARRIVGNALYRMQMMSKTQETFEGRLEGYLKGEPDPEEVKMVSKAGGRAPQKLNMGYGSSSSSGGVPLVGQTVPDQEAVSSTSVDPLESDDKADAAVGDLLGDFDPASNSGASSPTDDLLTFNQTKAQNPPADGSSNT